MRDGTGLVELVPVVGDLLDLRIREIDLEVLGIRRERARSVLPEQREPLPRLTAGEVDQVRLRIGLVVLDRVLGELVPGLDRRLDAGLVEQILAVDETERAAVP